MHFHYRSNTVMLAMGEPMLPAVRQMKNSHTDPYSGGRNFVSHICKPEWNVMPVTSTIETQFVVAPGTARAQWRQRKKTGKSGITIVVGGDAGSSSADFASCMIWSSRPGEELPLLMIVTNNKYGISTTYDQQHGEKHISDRAKAFGIQTAVIDGNSPERAWAGLQNALEYVRSTGKPFMLEANVSRLYGHSSSSGANRVNETCSIDLFSKKLLKQNWVTEADVQKMYDEAWVEANAALDQARTEAFPDASTMLDHSFKATETHSDKAGLPGRDS